MEAVLAEVIRSRFLDRQRRSVTAVHREVVRQCRVRELVAPSRGTVVRRIAQLDPVSVVMARQGADAARVLVSAGGSPPEVAGLLEQVQIDHTVVDLEIVDGRHRLPIGRPYVTVAIDVASRCVVGLVVTLEASSAVSVGLCLAHMARDKRPWLERLGVAVPYRTMSRPPISLWEQRAAVARLRELGRDQIDENALFAMVERMRQITETAHTTTRRTRRQNERRSELAAERAGAVPARPPACPPVAVPAVPVQPFEEIEQW